MKCKGCDWFVDGVCQKAQEEKLSEMDDVACLLRLQTRILLDVWAELRQLNSEDYVIEGDEDDDDSEKWKFPS